MIRVKNANPNNIINWVTKVGGIKKGQLVKEDTGATPVAAAHTGATLLGVALETQATTGGVAVIYPIQGTVLEIDFKPDATKVSCTAADLGTQFDMVVDGTTGEMVVDLDDTTGGYLILVGYGNDAKKGYFCVEAADCLLNI